MNKNTTVFLSLFTLAITLNLVVLNYTVFRLLPARLNTEFAPTFTPQPQDGERMELERCGYACQSAIQLSLHQVDQKIATLAAKSVLTSTNAALRKTVTPMPIAKETFVPMGTGATSKNAWEDLAGSDVYINTASFPNISQVYFEVSMHIPTKNGTMYARLYNVTDKHPVWYSDVSTDQDVSTFVSSKIKLDEGNKLYRIQLRTTLEYSSILDNARLKIISN